MTEHFSPAQIQEVTDTLENLVANLGTEADKRAATNFVNNKRLSASGNQQQLNALYRTDGICGKVVDIIPNDMTREWRYFSGEIDTDEIKMLTDEEDRLNLSGNFNLAHKWARLYGTSFIVLGVDDGLSPDKPLNLKTIKKGGLKYLNVVDRHRVYQGDVMVQDNPLLPNFGMPEFYRFANSAQKVHHSRLIRFDGVILPYDELKNQNYWSDSVLDRLLEAITDLNTTTSGSASMVYGANTDVISVDGLMHHLQSETGTKLLQKRFALANTLKSFNNMLLLDNKELFNKFNNTFSGLPDLIDRFLQIVSAITDIPATRLLGNSASGLNATGEGDLKNYYDMIRSRQKNEYKPKLDFFDEVMRKSLGLSDEFDMSYKFESLFQMTPQEQANLELTRAQRDAVYYDRGILTEAIITKELQQEGTYTNIDDEYVDELEEIENDFTNEFNIGPGSNKPAELGTEQQQNEEDDPEGTGGEVTEES